MDNHTYTDEAVPIQNASPYRVVVASIGTIHPPTPSPRHHGRDNDTQIAVAPAVARGRVTSTHQVPYGPPDVAPVRLTPMYSPIGTANGTVRYAPARCHQGARESGGGWCHHAGPHATANSRSARVASIARVQPATGVLVNAGVVT